MLGAAYTLAGRVPEALEMLENTVERAADRRVMFGQAQRVGWLAEGYLLARRRDKTCFERCATLGRQHYYVSNAETRALLKEFGLAPEDFRGLYTGAGTRSRGTAREVASALEKVTVGAVYDRPLSRTGTAGRSYATLQCLFVAVAIPAL